MERTKDVVRLTAALLCLAAPAPASEELAVALRGNVVAITAQFAEASGVPEDQGFGFVVGERDGRVIVVTANHVVRKGSAKARQVWVRYWQDQGRAQEAQLLETSSAELDLAVLEARAPGSLRWEREVQGAGSAARRGQKVWFVGRSGEWWVPTAPGAVNESTLNNRIRIDDLRVRPGSSGAPVVSQDGIVGMLVTDASGEESEALPIETIERALRKWNYPWALVPSPVGAPPGSPGAAVPAAPADPEPSTYYDPAGTWYGPGFSFVLTPTGPWQYLYAGFNLLGVQTEQGGATFDGSRLTVQAVNYLTGLPFSAQFDVSETALNGFVSVGGVQTPLQLHRTAGQQ